MMTFSQWLAANKYEESALTPEQRKHLEAAYRAEIAAANPPPPTPRSPSQVMDEAEANAVRNDEIRALCTAWLKDNPYASAEKVKQLRDLQDAAITDKKTTVADFKYQMLRFDRTVGMMITTPREDSMPTAEVIEAAICTTHKLGSVEKHFNEQTLDASHKRFKGGLTLNGLITIAARAAGYRGDIGGPANLLSMVQHIKRAQSGNGFEFMAGSGLSSLTIPNIVGSAANKFLVEQFLYGEQSWRRIAKIQTANNFQQMNLYRLTGSNKFIKIPHGGEIKHGTLGELTYTNQVDTYGIMLGIDRRDFINDDLGALTGRAGEVGQGAIDALNEVFWTEFMSNPTGSDGFAFFSTDHSNYDDGATDSVLTLVGLDNAESIFGLQTKPSGSPLGAMPKIILVPRALKNTGLNLMAPSVTAGAQSTPTVTVANVYAGRYDVVDSVYLQNSSITNYSTTAWYLLADPNNIAVILLAFLFGKDTPTIEESELDFNRLGMSMRAYMDFGCNLAEYRGGVKLKGAA